MRDKTHLESVERWAKFVKVNSNWRKYHTEFINSQFNNSYQFLEKLKKLPNGRNKIIRLYNIKNLNGYKKLLN